MAMTRDEIIAMLLEDGPLPSLCDRLSHILQAVGDIESLLAGQTKESLAADNMRQRAVERLFEIIAEASCFVPEGLRARESAVDWSRLIGLGDGLLDLDNPVPFEALVAIAERDLPPLRAAVEKMLREQQQS